MSDTHREIILDNETYGGSGGSGGGSSAVDISWAQYQALPESEKNNGTQYYIYDYPSIGGAYVFQTKAAMDAAIANGDVPENAICVTKDDTPYVVTAQDVSYGNGNVKTELDELNSNSFDNSVSLIPYTQSSPYVAPSDGYIFFQFLANGEQGYVRIKGADGQSSYTVGTTNSRQYEINMVFVKKGMLLDAENYTSDTNFAPVFIPLV